MTTHQKITFKHISTDNKSKCKWCIYINKWHWNVAPYVLASVALNDLPGNSAAQHMNINLSGDESRVAHLIF